MSVEIKSVYILSGDHLAYYNPTNNKIYYNEILDQFPDFREEVLKHELLHSSKPDNYFFHLWIDLRDYAKLKFHKDYFKVLQKISETNKPFLPNKFIHWMMIPVYFFLNIIIRAFWTPLDLFIIFISLFKKSRGDD